MKKLLISLVVLAFSATTALAQTDVFNHLAVGASVGTQGIGVDVATTLTRYAAFRVGMNFMPGIKVSDKMNGDINIGGVNTPAYFDVEGKFSRTTIDVAVDAYPFGNGFFVHGDCVAEKLLRSLDDFIGFGVVSVELNNFLPFIINLSVWNIALPQIFIIGKVAQMNQICEHIIFAFKACHSVVVRLNFNIDPLPAHHRDDIFLCACKVHSDFFCYNFVGTGLAPVRNEFSSYTCFYDSLRIVNFHALNFVAVVPALALIKISLIFFAQGFYLIVCEAGKFCVRLDIEHIHLIKSIQLGLNHILHNWKNSCEICK